MSKIAKAQGGCDIIFLTFIKLYWIELISKLYNKVMAPEILKSKIPI